MTTDGKMTREKAIQTIRDGADAFAEHVAPIYKLLDWTWHDAWIPTAPMIAKNINGLCDTAAKHGGDNWASGGLRIWIDDEDGIIKECGIDFTTTHSFYA